MYEGNQKVEAILADATGEEIETDSLRDRIKVLDSQIAQLEHAIGVIAQKLTPVLRPVLADPTTCVAEGAPNAVRSPAAERVHQQGQRIYQAHRDLHSIERRLSL